MHSMLYRIHYLFLLPILVGLLFFSVHPGYAQERGNTLPRVSPNATVGQAIGVTEVQLTYGRPSVRGRTIFGDLVPYGDIWRTGANEATTFSVSTPVQIEGERLDAGTYSLFTIPGKEAWTIVFNDEANQWGGYEYDSTQDVLRVEATPESAEMKEMMTFGFQNVTDTSATAALHWAETRVPFEITVNTPQVIQAQAEETISTSEDWQTPLRYAAYALENEILTEDALKWVDASIDREERFENLSIKARLLAAEGQYEQAISTAETALTRAESREESPSGVKDLQQSLHEWEAEL